MRDAIMTAFEVFGLLFIAAALGVVGGDVGGLAAGLGVVGVVLVIEAFLMDFLGSGRPIEVDE